MATNKRERQRANRAEKQALAAKAARRQRSLRIGKRVAIYAVIIAIVFVVVSLLTSGDDDAAETSAPPAITAVA